MPRTRVIKAPLHRCQAPQDLDRRFEVECSKPRAHRLTQDFTAALAARSLVMQSSSRSLKSHLRNLT